MVVAIATILMITKLSVSYSMENVIDILCETVPDLCDARVKERMMVERSKKVTKMLGKPVGTRNKIKGVYMYV